MNEQIHSVVGGKASDLAALVPSPGILPTAAAFFKKGGSCLSVSPPCLSVPAVGVGQGLLGHPQAGGTPLPTEEPTFH